jgi:hypothetical protein
MACLLVDEVKQGNQYHKFWSIPVGFDHLTTGQLPKQLDFSYTLVTLVTLPELMCNVKGIIFITYDGNSYG